MPETVPKLPGKAAELARLSFAGELPTVKLAALLAAPAGVLTPMAPVEAPAGTAAVSWVDEFTVKDAGTPLKATAVAPVRFAPLITTISPALPLFGTKLAMAGA